MTAGIHLRTHEIGVEQMHYMVSIFSIYYHLDSDSHAYTHAGLRLLPS